MPVGSSPPVSPRLSTLSLSEQEIDLLRRMARYRRATKQIPDDDPGTYVRWLAQQDEEAARREIAARRR